MISSSARRALLAIDDVDRAHAVRVRIDGPVAVLVTGANVDVTVLARIVGEEAVRSR